MADRIGQQLGAYRLIRLIGTGSFAEVYLGEHVDLGTQVAVKVLSTQLAGEEAERFQEEARIVGRLAHPHIARTFDLGVDDGLPFLVMDYAPNGTLRQLFPRGTPLAPGTILPYVWQVADALHFAHGQQCIHRGVKPENMLLDARNEVLLSDFGIPVVFQSPDYQAAQENIGTATYLAPEQMQGQARPASDQYALAVIVYEWLSGMPPFQGSRAEVLTQHHFSAPPPLHERVRTISPAVEAVIMGALSKDPADRFPSIQSFAAAFEDACQAMPVLLFMPPRLTTPLAVEKQELADDEVETPTMPLPVPALPSSPAARRAANAETVRAAPVPSHSDPIVPITTESPATPAKTGPRITWQEAEWTSPSITLDMAPLPEPLVQGRQGLSRRTVLIGSVAGLAVAGGALTWLGLRAFSAHSTFSSSTPAGTMPKATTSANRPTATPILPGAVIFTYQGHSGFVRSVSWSPDGMRIASASDDHTAQVWDALTGANAMIYKEHSREVMAVAWSPGGTSIASGSQDQTLRVWDAVTGKTLHSYTFGHWVTSVAWSPNGKYLAAGSWDYTVQVWNTTTWQRVRRFSAPGWVNALAWSPDNTHLVSGDGSKLAVIWNVITGDKILIYRGHTSAVLSLAWSHDGKQIASGADFPDTTVQCWNTANGKPLWSADTKDHTPSLAWSSNGKQLAAGGGSVYLLNPLTGERLFTYQRNAWTLAWSPDGQYIASGGPSTTVQVWQIT